MKRTESFVIHNNVCCLLPFQLMQCHDTSKTIAVFHTEFHIAHQNNSYQIHISSTRYDIDLESIRASSCLQSMPTEIHSNRIALRYITLHQYGI